MKKRKVLSFFSVLLLLAVALGALNFAQTGNIVGKITDTSYSQELFVGDNYGFTFNPNNIYVENGNLFVKGNLKELLGKSHDLDITIYAFDSQGVVAGEYKEKAFLNKDNNLLLNINFPYNSNEKLSEVFLYFDDKDTTVKGTYVNQKFSLTGNAINTLYNEGKGNGALLGIVIIVVLGFIVIKTFSRYKKQVNLANSFNKNEDRRFIDLDIR